MDIFTKRIQMIRVSFWKVCGAMPKRTKTRTGRELQQEHQLKIHKARER
jgi:hypothetical protein